MSGHHQAYARHGSPPDPNARVRAQRGVIGAMLKGLSSRFRQRRSRQRSTARIGGV